MSNLPGVGWTSEAFQIGKRNQRSIQIINTSINQHPIEIKIKKNEKFKVSRALTAVITVTVCKKRFEWFLSISEGLLDVTPIVASFAHVTFDCYAVSDQLFDFKPNENGDYDISAVAELIVSEFLLQQENNVCLMSNNNSSNINSDTNNKLEFALEMLQIKKSISMIVWTDEKQLILCEFPLLSNRSNTSPSLEYLLSVTERQPIMISLILDIGNNDCKIDYKVLFPPSMVCSKNIDFHKNNGNINDDNYLLELFPNIEEKLSINWLKRKAFLEELQRLIAVLEYDAVDFSFIMIALRMKHDKMYTLCTVEFRLSHLFPMQLPLMKLHDLQNSFDSNIDTSSIKVKTFWTPERLARELLLLSSSVISLQAFGVDILQAM